MKERVIDVSRWQGTIDFNKIKAAGVYGVIVRVGAESRYFTADRLDRKAHENLLGAIKAGLHVGAYLYATALSSANSQLEAKWLDEQIAPYKGKLDLPVYYDVEGNMLKQSKSQLTAEVKAFVAEMESRGWWTGLYTGKYVMRDQLDMSQIGCTVWLAQYNTEPTYNGPFDMWQFTDKWRVDGIAGNVDCSWLYRDLPTEIRAAGLNGYNKPGDVDGDGKVTAEDARLALRQALGKDPKTSAADYDGDGDVTAEDAREILRDALKEIRE